MMISSLTNTLRTYQKYARENPIGYVKNVLGITPHEKQIPILEALKDPSNNLICWRSGNAVGKTYLTASIIANYLDSNYPGYAIISGASWTGILKTVMPTLKKVVREAPVDLGGTLLTSEWRRGDMWGAFCISPDEPENFGGFRTKRGCLVIVDEASSLDYQTMEAIRGLCSAEGSRIILLGNPLRPEGPFYDAFSDPSWLSFHTDSRDVAKLDVPGLATDEWVEEMKVAYGEDHPAYIARVKGDFPDASEDSLIPENWADHIKTDEDGSQNGELILGVDIARFGSDRSVFLTRDDAEVRDIQTTTKKALTDTCGRITRIMSEDGIHEENVYVDDCGVGGGVTDILTEDGYSINAINFGEKADDTERYANCRAEAHWNMRTALNPETDQFHVHRRWHTLLKELHMARYGYTNKGQIKIEPKELIKKRLKRSPDESDALALTFASTASNFSIGLI